MGIRGWGITGQNEGFLVGIVGKAWPEQIAKPRLVRVPNHVKVIDESVDVKRHLPFAHLNEVRPINLYHDGVDSVAVGQNRIALKANTSPSQVDRLMWQFRRHLT